MIFMSTTSTTVGSGALQLKSNAAVTFHQMRVHANISGWGERAIVEFLKLSK